MSRFKIHLFYLLLAITQFFILFLLSEDFFPLKIDLMNTIIIISLSSILGNYLVDRFNMNMINFIYLLAFISSISLIFKYYFY